MARAVLNDIHLHYPVSDGSFSFRKAIVKGMSAGKIADKEKPSVRTFHALRGISFTLEDGDRIGLIGRNGAGKSTLLRILAGIYEPTRGEITLEGSVESLLQIGFGVEPEETGRENSVFVMKLLGTPPRHIPDIVREIEEFTELGEFFDRPVRTYSQGMQTRLGFALATTHAPEILLMDEIIGAGDVRFYEKAEARIADLADRTRIVVLASHSLDLIRKWCNRALWLDKGQIRQLGPVDEVIDAYLAK